MKRVENETAELQLEVHSAREQSVLAEKIAAMELSKKQEEMELVRQQALKLQDELTLKKLELEMLTSDQQVLTEGLEKVQGKLVQANKDGLALIEENEASIRSQTGVVRVLRSNAGTTFHIYKYFLSKSIYLSIYLCLDIIMMMMIMYV